MKTEIKNAFINRFGIEPEFVVRAPGRVNLIGEHTDYNDGFVLPMAIDRAIWIALRRRDDRQVVVYSLDFEDPAQFSLDNIPSRDGTWADFVRGIAQVLQENGYELSGWEGVLTSDVPIGAGLSSSAALGLSISRAFCAVSDWVWDGKAAALLAQKTENTYIGVQSGIMDQMISAVGRSGSALLLDCRSLETQFVPIPEGSTVIVLDTATRRGLVDSAYNERVAQCRLAAKGLGVASLRDADPDLFAQKSEALDPIARKRARHVIFEDDRTLQAALAMRAGDAAFLGELMNASHDSLRDDYEVSSAELDAMVEAARTQAGCYGARMTGAGFGGCAVALVRTDSVDDFVKNVGAQYREKTGLTPNIYVCEPTNGAEIVG